MKMFADADQSPFEQEESGPNPVLLLHRALRGRYWLAALLAVLFGVPGALVGYSLSQPKYTSRAVLEASPTLPALLYENELNEKLPAFEAFVRQQGARLMSERVLSKALDNDALKEAGWPAGTEGMIRLRSSLGVSTPKKTNQIIVTVTDPDPKLARLAAAAVIESYEAIRKEFESTSFGQREQELERLRDRYQRDRDEKRRLALDRSLNVAGSEDLQAVQHRKMEELARIEDEIRTLAEQRRVLSGSTPEIAPVVEMEDPELAKLKDEAMQLRRTLDSLLQTMTPKHRQVKRVQSELNVVNALIESREHELRDARAAASTPSGEPMPQDLDQLEARITSLTAEREKIQKTLERIAKARLEVLSLQQEADEANTRFEDAERRLESLRVEQKSQIVGRIRIAQEPERPLRPSSDRRVQLGAVGLVGGAGLGVALVSAFGLVFSRVRVSEDISLTARDYSMLGMIPEFPDPDDEQSGRDLLDSFHLLRVLIDARSDAGCLVAGITSPISGDGKTTISLLLARSFAMTQRRVLLIDADLVGRGLSRMLNLRPKGNETEGPLGDLVVPIEGGTIDVLPSPDSDTGADRFCRHVIQRRLEEARRLYDVVLLDTGPILGSIEAASMVPVVDQMLLIVSRGTESRMLRMSTNRLRELRASRVGIVFNRASTVDFHRSYSPVSSASRRHSSRTFKAVLPPMMAEEHREQRREGTHG
ncbi:MAG TPA: hypothetical protein ENK11_01105 [Phycisphaerales bacterium]|nr:hypothetical protein [Phycisphaerales bacterium]